MKHSKSHWAVRWLKTKSWVTTKHPQSYETQIHYLHSLAPLGSCRILSTRLPSITCNSKLLLRSLKSPFLSLPVCFVSPPQILAYPNLQQYATQQPCSKQGRYRTSEYRFSSATMLIQRPDIPVQLEFKINLIMAWGTCCLWVRAGSSRGAVEKRAGSKLCRTEIPRGGWSVLLWRECVSASPLWGTGLFLVINNILQLYCTIWVLGPCRSNKMMRFWELQERLVISRE